MSVIIPLFMITVMPRAMPMMSATPSRSRDAVDERAGQVRLGETADDADHDGEEEERGRHLGEPPPERGEPDAHVLPGDDAVDHHQEGEEEEGEDDLATPGEGAERRSASCPDRKCRSFSSFWAKTSDFEGSALHFLGVAHHEEDADGETDDEHEEPEHDAVG